MKSNNTIQSNHATFAGLNLFDLSMSSRCYVMNRCPVQGAFAPRPVIVRDPDQDDVFYRSYMR